MTAGGAPITMSMVECEHSRSMARTPDHQQPAVVRLGVRATIVIAVGPSMPPAARLGGAAGIAPREPWLESCSVPPGHAADAVVHRRRDWVWQDGHLPCADVHREEGIGFLRADFPLAKCHPKTMGGAIHSLCSSTVGPIDIARPDGDEWRTAYTGAYLSI
jgi:hypothetical protein